MTSSDPLHTDERSHLVEQRLEALRSIIAERGADSIVLRTRRDFAWLTMGGQNHVALFTETGVAPLVVTLDDAIVLAPTNEYDRLADEELRGLSLRPISIPWWDSEAIGREIASNSGGPAVLEVDDISDQMDALRTHLSAPEHARMAFIADLVNAAMASALETVRQGSTEDALAGQLAGRFAEAGARLPVILVASDDRISRYRHPLPTAKKIDQRVMIVVVAERWGLHVAATEFVGLVPRPADVAARAAAVRDVLETMREVTTPGKTLGDVFAAARATYTSHGMPDEWQLHHQGGTIGYAPRERVATPDDATPIVPGMAFAWNPSAVGYKMEETLYLDPDGNQHVLTTTRS